MNDKPPVVRTLANNRRALHEYHVLERIEAGVALTGTEVKSCRTGKIQLQEGYVEMRRGEAWLLGVHIAQYSHGGRENHLPDRERKLLLSRREIDRLAGRVQAKGLTLVPLSVYLKGSRIKVEIALVQGKKLHDKRETERRRELEREARAAMRGEPI
ncbi:MAG: SsrA-binding protein SmpB [Acidobacteria bacterium]|nr:SsrA-binding protein SmpB [Acidobacteriota bacterium]MCB9377837.1 SsrA-binding protein SmpB [Holophagales bacterium]